MGWSSGTYTRTNGTYSGSGVWASDAAAAVKIRADRHDTHDQDLAQGINACLNKNGENSPTVDINWGGFKITNIANGAAATDVAAYGQTITAFTFNSGTNVLTATRNAGNLTVDLSALAGGVGGGAPTDATYLTLSANGTLTNESVLSAGSGLSLTAGTGTATIAMSNSGVTAGTYNLATITVNNRGQITSASSGSAGSGTVTSVNASGGSTGLSFSGGPVTTTGTLTLAGTLALANGGTGATTASGARTALGLGTWATKAQTVSTADASGTPADGDVWLRYTP